MVLNFSSGEFLDDHLEHIQPVEVGGDAHIALRDELKPSDAIMFGPGSVDIHGKIRRREGIVGRWMASVEGLGWG